MPHYMFPALYSQAGLQGILKEGAASRSDGVKASARDWVAV